MQTTIKIRRFRTPRLHSACRGPLEPARARFYRLARRRCRWVASCSDGALLTLEGFGPTREDAAAALEAQR